VDKDQLKSRQRLLENPDPQGQMQNSLLKPKYCGAAVPKKGSRPPHNPPQQELAKRVRRRRSDAALPAAVVSLLNFRKDSERGCLGCQTWNSYSIRTCIEVSDLPYPWSYGDNLTGRRIFRQRS
jgi:hypothetical protein